MNIAEITVSGNLGQAPEIKEVNGTKVANFSIAVNENYRDKSGERQSKTHWYNVEAWDGKSKDGKASGVVTNIRPNETYTYEFESLHTNWPVSIMPLSGTVIPSTKTYSIDADITFCPSLNTGLCPDGQAGLLDYTAMEGCSINNTDPKSLYQLKLVPTSFEGNTIYSNSAKAVCDGCIRSISFDTENYTSSLEDTNVHEFEIALSGLTAGQQYTYSIMPLESNWPTLFITPTGYDFTAYDSTVTIPNSMQFCPTSGFCPPGADGVIPYTQPIKIVNKYFSSFYVRVSPATDCHDNLNLDSNNSRQMTVYCNDCL